ncbi:Calmodulin [Hondaea fermentalgiana]|uniref:Calmodulin n=1 Tax=Hondaea fermentalgiana TaxID=2315210 RepID=A0A2R5GHY4_9STRA|nr:Calmodulin [Hondaea fermentalgiana]|eukprot:GBG27901.1 Calmodulin [Hondaea fermentalgiana]
MPDGTVDAEREGEDEQRTEADGEAAAETGILSSLESSPFTVRSAEDLSEEELAEYREIFNLVDRDGGGSISNSELGDLMDTLGINASQEEIDLMINEIDQDSNGEIDFEEFVAVMSRRVKAAYTPDQVRNAFSFFAGDATPGLIKPECLERVLLDYCSDRVNKDQVQELLRQLETDSNGLFNYTEYISMMMS